MLLSATLWHLLHITSPADFQSQLAQLSTAAESYRNAAEQAGSAGGDAGSGGPALVLTSSTETFPNRMRKEEKRQNMTPANVDAYNEALEKVWHSFVCK